MKLSMMFLQAIIAGLVVAANIYWNFTPNATLAAILGGVLAYALTVLLPGLLLRPPRSRSGDQ